jgi:hypothetical protein
MGEFSFVLFITLIVVAAGLAVKSESDDIKRFNNQCIEAGGNPVRLAKQGNICLKDAAQIPLIIKVL